MFNNDPSYTDRIVAFDRPFLIDLNECGVCAANYEDLIKLLPERLQVRVCVLIKLPVWVFSPSLQHRSRHNIVLLCSVETDNT